MKKISDKDYFAHPAINRSFLWEILQKSVLHALESKKDDEKESDAFIFGKAVHMAILEPHLFASHYVRFPGLNRRLKEHREKIESFTKQGITVLDDEDFSRIAAIRAKVYAHPVASQLFLGEGENEFAVFWKDISTDIECKIKIDRCRKDGILVDLKTAASAGRMFQRAAFEHGYHMQAAFYSDGMRANGVEIEAFIFVVIESEPPHDIVVYQASSDMIRLGRESYQRALEKYAESLTEGAKGYAEEIQILHPPVWMSKNREI